MKDTQINSKKESKLVIITRNDLTPGYQAQQSTHSIADFASEYNEQFREWKKDSNSIICLSVKNEQELDSLYEKLSKLTSVTKFYEPDLDNQLTSICLYATYDVRKKVSDLPLLGKQPKLTYKQVIFDMVNTKQTEGQNVLEHGLSVNNYYNDLINDTSLKEWKLPTWFVDNNEFIFSNLYDKEIIDEYQILHDIGKPYCIEFDSDSRKHFPNHAQVSYDTYNKISDNKLVADLILKDMTFHTIKSAELEDFVKNNDIKTIITLLITSLCELHSNASMFGGINSDSFKMKFKQLDRRGKQLFNLLSK